MDPRAWRKVDQIFQSAIDRPQAEREAFLRDACANDPELEREVRSLLGWREKTGSLLGRLSAERIGQTISHYQILSKLGEGGMGVVYKAEDVSLKRAVALKFLPSQSDEHRERFRREARAAAALNHPNICTIHEIDDENGFIAMELIEGPSVKDRIQERPLPLDEAIRIAIDACTGLRAAHEKGVVHRDIKPGNLMITAGGHVKVMDFGLAQVDDQTRITQTGTSLGTPAYMSPEQIRGQPTDRRTDIWSIGVVLFEILTGRRPFTGDTVQAVSFSIVHTEPEPVTALRSGLPVEVDGIVAKALAKSAEERYQNVADLIVDLRRVTTSPATGRPRRQFRWAYALAAAFILAMVSFVIWRMRPSPHSINSIVILPLRPLSPEATNSFLGLGIADALITRIGQNGQLEVRSINAVRKYAREDSDPLEVARHMNTETVLAGSLQQSGSRVRVSVQLLRTTTGAIMWAQSFDINSGDVFTVQDEIAREVAAQLRLKLDAGQRRDFDKRSTSNQEAFEFYSKALYHLSNRMRAGELQLSTELLQRAIELDPNYALARAQLGYSYAVYGVFQKDDPEIIDLATRQLAEAEKLDPRNAQVHAGRSVILYSRFGHWNLREAILEGRAAVRLDHNVGHADLAYYYDHIGLEALAAKHRYASLVSDPDNEYYKTGLVGHYYGFMLADEGAAAEQKLYHRSPSIDYYLIKGLVKEAAPLIEQQHAGNQTGSRNSTDLISRIQYAQLHALQGNFGAAGKEIGEIEIEVEKSPQSLPFHHNTYGIAQVRARMGDAARALHWLQITVDTGWPQYPMMARDHMLDPVRHDPAVARFLAALKTTWENNRSEFGDESQ
ncbi:MAG TPA: protein kinase [Bryobacteraceae bacterium]|jgi:serine/threonine protein kinase|nr:protein kinase [Bryobacteraceae bacterium]